MTIPPLRADIDDLEGYHSPQLDVSVRLNTNESPYPPPPDFVSSWLEALRHVPLNRYPDRAARDLRHALAEFLGQPAERVFCANGSNEVLQCLLLAYGGPGRSAAVFEPSYVLHSHISRVTGTALVTGERRPDDLTLDVDAAVDLVTTARPEITFLCSPNNPSGVVDDREAVEAVLDAAPGLVVVDEAYGEFSPWSALDLVDGERPIVVARTFSKVWSMAAMRLGFCVAPPEVVKALETVVMPYHLSVATQLAGTHALRWRAEMEERVHTIVTERERLMAGLAGLDGLRTFPSGANFVLVRPDRDGREVWEGLVERGVIVRDFSHMPRLANCLRVTIGTPDENDAFLGALKEVLS
jgi:histidinol-phosphate aminotransferase